MDTEANGSRRRGCNCRKSGCLKLYCECFAANGRCDTLCQCVGCKNQDHNRLEIAHAIQAIEKRTQKPFRSSAPVTTPPSAAPAAPRASSAKQKPPDPMTTSSAPTSAPATFPTERKAAMAMAGTSPRPVCGCKDGICTSACPCLSLIGACSTRCPCKGCQVLKPQEKTKGCSCKKSNCLKLYCECLAAQRMCDHRCNCEGCKNRPETLVDRERAVAAILERNPLAFQPKVSNGSSQHLRGCNCRKSGCMKNYCECHQAGVPCTSRCACHQCRNTEPFVSARKVLVFAGVNTNGSQDQRKSARRTSRKSPSAADTEETQHYLLETPTHSSTQRPSALELLSRSAPAAPQLYLQDNSSMYGGDPTTPTKRTSSHLEHYHTAGGGAVTPTFAKRKYSKRASNRPPFMERIEEAAAQAATLPDVTTAVCNVYNAKNLQARTNVEEPELATLSRSLLHAAMAVESTEEGKGTPPTAASRTSQLEQRAGGTAADAPRGGESIDNRGVLSPTAAGLFCEEDYDEVAGDDGDRQELMADSVNGNGTAWNAKPDQRLDRRQETSLSALQERAVLQEISVWLRNMAAGAP